MKEPMYRLFMFMVALLAGAGWENTAPADYPAEQDYFQKLPIVPSASRFALAVQNALNDPYSDYNASIIGKRRAYLAVTLGF